MLDTDVFVFLIYYCSPGSVILRTYEIYRVRRSKAYGIFYVAAKILRQKCVFDKKKKVKALKRYFRRNVSKFNDLNTSANRVIFERRQGR